MDTDVITLITKDHRTVEGLFERLNKKEGDQHATVVELHALLIAHARAEEDEVYPDIDAHHSLEEHKEAEILLDALVRAEPGTKEFDRALNKLIKSVNHHVREEEKRILPAMAESVSTKRLQDLGKAFKKRRAEELDALTPKGRPAHGPTKAELYEQAQKADIPGRSRMGKEELVQALRSAKPS
ncbi:hemerythrin domain-containing protein [Nonomuraea turkmeniaca]|uniref:Hemerythrin domain-containing protein n=1 Tax=Nonomuraea turkmeniaca TaxID=103838 RepID=A0A5S4FBX3_9ACTN|nr:hemerythrin domain-containing protein [Nonomuraea turkmeniaca]TMR15499.1 hemerythrin domain-containing protein [Nonomuraea turkmeniaca]